MMCYILEAYYYTEHLKWEQEGLKTHASKTLKIEFIEFVQLKTYEKKWTQKELDMK